MIRNQYSAWVEVDLESIRHNVKQFQRITQQPVMAVVKANAYGHGMLEVARAAEQAGASWCGVARFEEALNLRQAGITSHILVMGYTPPARAAAAAAANISVSVYDMDTIREYAAQVKDTGWLLRVHLKIDSGMGRLGLFSSEVMPVAREIKMLPEISLDGIFTHFARADEPDQPTTLDQLKRFEGVLSALQSEAIVPHWIHAANSAAAIYFPPATFNLTRTGIGIYGLHPSDQAPLSESFCPALSWKTRLTAVKNMPSGYGISYGHRYFTVHAEKIGVIAIGYADGFRRQSGNFALVRGHKVPVVGTICMDQCMVQLDHVPDARIGDEVVLIGRQGDERISAEDIARAWNTINYEVVCGLSTRLPRMYFNADG